jgi:uncharacterized Fe-S cluster-containing radical SAM superfamily protein
MKVSEIRNCRNLRPMKIPAREVPHAVLESNYTCNRQCTHCYNRFRGIVKPLEQIRAEIDQAMAKRNLETISILGGEPTLHPHLPEIVRYIKSRNLVCQILTNGVVLLKAGGDALLDRLIDAGLDRIVVHVDDGQGLNEQEVEEMRTSLFTKFERRKLAFALSITLSSDKPDAVPGVMKRYARYRYFDGILATVARHMDQVVQSLTSSNGSPELSDVYVNISGGLQVEPSSYLPSNLDDREVRWLIYFYYLNATTGKSVSTSPVFTRLMRRAYRLLTGRHLFAVPMRPLLSKLWFLCTSLVEILLDPVNIFRYVHLVRNSALLRSIRFQYIVVQSAPQFNAEKQCVELCYHCPDATIRNGKLAPVCLADWISPPGEHHADSGREPLMSETVYAHLEEA